MMKPLGGRPVTGYESVELAREDAIDSVSGYAKQPTGQNGPKIFLFDCISYIMQYFKSREARLGGVT